MKTTISTILLSFLCMVQLKATFDLNITRTVVTASQPALNGGIKRSRQ